MSALRLSGFGALLALLTGLAGPAQAQTVVRYVHTDALGSVVALTDESRMVVERREYEPYGAQLTPAVQDGPGYTGHVQDSATGLVYMQQRYYDPGIGRFLSVDPIATNPNTGHGFNRYAYVLNNPYKFTDPDGRCEKVTGSHICGNGVAKAMLATSLRSPIDTGQKVPNRSATNALADKVSQQRISQLHPKVQGPATAFISQVKEQTGTTLRVVQGLRTNAEQDALYAQGRTKPGDIVTNAQGGQSFHNYGLAIDVAGLNSNGTINWNIDYKAISEIGKVNGFEWGGDFKSFKDMPHFQMPFGLTLKQLQSGETP